MSRFLITEEALLAYGTTFKPKLTEKLSAIGDQELSSLVTTLMEQYEKTVEYGEGLIKQSVLQAEERDTAVIQAVQAFSATDAKLASLMREMKGVIALFTFLHFLLVQSLTSLIYPLFESTTPWMRSGSSRL